MRRVILIVALLLWPVAVSAQQTVRSATQAATGSLAASTGFFIIPTDGYATARIQTLDTYSGTWELQCSTDQGVTYDTDDEIPLILLGGDTADNVSDVVGVWDANIAGCSHIKIAATAGFAATDVSVRVNLFAGGGSIGGSLTTTLTDIEGQLVLIQGQTDAIEAPLAELGDAITASILSVDVKKIDGSTPTPDLTFDMDTGAGTQTRSAVGLATAASGGATQVTGGNGVASTALRVTLASDSTGVVKQWDGTSTAAVDPCESETKVTDPISIITDTVIITAVAAKKNYICSLVIVAAAAEIVSITEGTGALCATSEAALMGSTTDANGVSLAANSGPVIVGGVATSIAGKTANVDTCLNVSGTNRVSGFVTWVQR